MTSPDPGNMGNDLPMAPPSGAPVSLPAPPKKPLVKRWWFWVLVAFGGFIIIGALSSGDSSTSTSDAGASPSASEPKEIIGGNLKDAIDTVLTAGIDEGSITVVGVESMMSFDETVYDSSGFSIDNIGSEDFQRSLTVCGVREGESGSASVVIWAEESCSEAEARIAQMKVEAAAESASPEPSPTVAATPEGPTDGFALLAAGDIRDMAKDLDDMTVALSEGGLLRLMGNSLELSFNIGQLQSLVPPDSVADEWTEGLSALSAQVDQLSNVISGDASEKKVAREIAATLDALTALLKVVDKAE